jgi:hypothetical protein
LEFHLSQKDFEKWIEFTLGDIRLAADLRRLREQKLVGENLRTLLSLLVSGRLKELKSTSLPKARKQSKSKTNI